MTRTALPITLAAALAFTALASAQSDAPARLGDPQTESEFASPVIVDLSPPPPPQEECWLRADYVFWTATNKHGLNTGRETGSNPLFNSLLRLTGKQTSLLEAPFQGDRIGYALTLGCWLDPTQQIGVEASAFYLFRESSTVSLLSANARPLGADPGILFPAVPAVGGGVAQVPFASPAANGAVSLGLNNLLVYGLGVNARGRIVESDGMRLDGLLGLRRLEVEGTIGASSIVTGLGPPLLPGTAVTTQEKTFSEAVYSGPVIGLDYQVRSAGWEFGVRPSVQFSYIQTTLKRDTGALVMMPGALTPMASASRIISYRGVNVVPELDVRVAKYLCENVRLVLGGSLFIFPDASPPDSQLNLGLPPEGMPGGGLPQVGRLAVPPVRETVYVFTMSVGLEFRF